MDIVPTSEQQQIIDTCAGFLSSRLPLRRLHDEQVAPDVVSGSIWSEIADMGWLAMSIPVEHGGVGYSAAEEVLVFQQIGRVLAPPRILTTALAAKIASAAGESDLVQKIVSGEVSAGYVAPGEGPSNLEGTALRRVYEYKGAKLAVAFDGDVAQLFQIDNVDFKPAGSLDKSVSQAKADLRKASIVAQIKSPDIRRSAALLSAAMLIGLSETALDMIVEYAKIRTTFGRPIGSYQAVRHPCAEMATRNEASKAQLYFASLRLADGAEDVDLHVSSARVLAVDAALRNTDDNIQLHGGIGVTDELDAHLLMKRANMISKWFECDRTHLDRVLNSQIAAI